MKRRQKRPATKAKARKRVPLKLVEGQDFERSTGGEIVIPVGGFERVAQAIFSGRDVTATVDDAVVLRIKAK